MIITLKVTHSISIKLLVVDTLSPCQIIILCACRLVLRSSSGKKLIFMSLTVKGKDNLCNKVLFYIFTYIHITYFGVFESIKIGRSEPHSQQQTRKIVHNNNNINNILMYFTSHLCVCYLSNYIISCMMYIV